MVHFQQVENGRLWGSRRLEGGLGREGRALCGLRKSKAHCGFAGRQAGVPTSRAGRGRSRLGFRFIDSLPSALKCRIPEEVERRQVWLLVAQWKELE